MACRRFNASDNATGMEVLLQHYERELEAPLRNAVTGTLPRSLLIQVCSAPMHTVVEKKKNWFVNNCTKRTKPRVYRRHRPLAHTDGPRLWLRGQPRTSCRDSAPLPCNHTEGPDLLALPQRVHSDAPESRGQSQRSNPARA